MHIKNFMKQIYHVKDFECIKKNRADQYAL